MDRTWLSLGEPAFVYRQAVQWVDTDAARIAHFTAVFRWAEAAETTWLRDLGLMDLRRLDQGVVLPRVHVEADYRRPFRFGDTVVVALYPRALGRSSLSVEHHLREEGDPVGEPPRAVVRVTFVQADVVRGRSLPWPPEVRQLFVHLGAKAQEDM
jgi:YbgC/YbaW family acyl-CoA thioester hydrolase